ncbi:MAG: ABC transporter substrate binding protein [Acidobacteriota bacterium]
MKRRDVLIAPLAFSMSSLGWTQQATKVWRIGFLGVRQEPALLDAFARGMSDLGYVEGKNLVIESRSAERKTERLRDLADDLVRLNVDVIVTAGTVATRAAQRATSAMPIVMGASGDPVGNGLVKSLGTPRRQYHGIFDPED